jgi:hypothetical protein
MDFDARSDLELGCKTRTEKCAEAEDKDVVFIGRRLERMGQGNLLLGFGQGNFKPTMWTMESCAFELIATNLRIFIVAEVGKRPKENCSLADE